MSFFVVRCTKYLYNRNINIDILEELRIKELNNIIKYYINISKTYLERIANNRIPKVTCNM